MIPYCPRDVLLPAVLYVAAIGMNRKRDTSRDAERSVSEPVVRGGVTTLQNHHHLVLITYGTLLLFTLA